MVEGSLISESSLQDCTTNGTDPMDCKKKLVVSLALPADLKAGAESINFLDSAQESGSNQTVTFPKIELSLSRTAVVYRYPIFYLSDFAADPYELTIDGSLANLCDDSFTTKATCGLQMDAEGNAIPYSQGFCCDCSICSAIKVCEANARSALACDIFGAYSSASCLRFGSLWYSGFTIGSASVWFEIELNLARHTGNGTVVESSTMVLSPNQLGASDAKFGCEAELVGTFSPSVEPQYFGDKMLFVPSMPSNSSIVKAGLPEYMILPDTMVTVDGTECNKVGVSYYAFNSQGNRCEMDSGSCLQNQLTDLRTSDMSRIAEGLPPQYLVAAYGEVSLQEYESEESSAEENKSDGGSATAPSPYLTYVSSAPPETLITLTINADTLQYVVAVASGKIISTHVNHGAVEAMSKDAVLQVEIQNTGDVVSEFTVDVLNCTGGVFPIPGQHISLSPNETSTLSYQVYMQNNTNTSASCVVSLLNALMVQVSSKTVSWNVTEIKKNDGAQGGTIGENGPTTSTTAKGSCEDCNFINILCIVKNKCYGKGGGFLGMILGLLALGALLVLFRSKIFWLLRHCCCCSSCCSTGSRSTKKKSVSYQKKSDYATEGEALDSGTTQERAKWKNEAVVVECVPLGSSWNFPQRKLEGGSNNARGVNAYYHGGSSERLVRSMNRAEEQEPVREGIRWEGGSGEPQRASSLRDSLRRRAPSNWEYQEGFPPFGSSSLSSMRAFVDVEADDGGQGRLSEKGFALEEFSRRRQCIPDCAKQLVSSLSLRDPLCGSGVDWLERRGRSPY